MVMCDNDGCKFNNDRVCARDKVYCVDGRCRNSRRCNIVDLMRAPDYAPKANDIADGCEKN